MPRLQFEQWVRSPIEEVFLFFADPNNLPRIMPPETGTRLEELRLIAPPGNASLAGAGSEIVTSFRIVPLLPIRARWVARITEFEWNHHFADLQEKGPFKSFHHRHEFLAQDRNGVAGTQVRDVVDYEIGYGFAGTLAERLFIRSRLESTFAYRQRALEKFLT